MKPWQSFESSNPVTLEAVRPYEYAHAIQLSHPDKKVFLKLNCNEATYGPSPQVQKALMDFIANEPLQWYPDTAATDLRKALSAYVGYSEDFISAFNGCDHALESICRAFLRQGDEVVVFAPNYDNFRLFVEVTGSYVRPVYASSAFSSNVEGLLKVLNARTRLIYLSNPTNPTGVTYSIPEIAWILEKAKQAVVIVDEAYFEFWGQSALPLVAQYPNLIITRSFSKAFAMAGLRCGYIVSQPENIVLLETIRNGKNVNALAQVAATATLSDLPYYQDKIKELGEAGEWLHRQFQSMNLESVTTPANFILVRVGDPDLAEHALMSKNILVRNRSRMAQLEGYLRVTVGLKPDMERFLECFQELDPEVLYRNQRHPLLMNVSE